MTFPAFVFLLPAIRLSIPPFRAPRLVNNPSFFSLNQCLLVPRASPFCFFFAVNPPTLTSCMPQMNAKVHLPLQHPIVPSSFLSQRSTWRRSRGLNSPRSLAQARIIQLEALRETRGLTNHPNARGGLEERLSQHGAQVRG